MGGRTIGRQRIKSKPIKALERTLETERLVSEGGPEGSDSDGDEVLDLRPGDVIKFRQKNHQVILITPDIVVLVPANGNGPQLSMSPDKLKGIKPKVVSQGSPANGRRVKMG